MAVGGSDVGNGNVDGPGLGDNCRQEARRGRTEKYSYVEDIGIKDDRERITVPSYPPLYGDGVGDKYNDQDVSSRPCAST